MLFVLELGESELELELESELLELGTGLELPASHGRAARWQ